MNWLNDKKNQPIVAGVAALVIVGVLVFIYMKYIKQPTLEPMPGPEASAPMPEETAPADTAPAPIEPAPAEVTTAASEPAQQPAAQQTAMMPMETWRGDPFLPVGYKPPKKENKVSLKPPILDFPFPKFRPPLPERELQEEPEPQQPPRRMAGLLLNNGVYAIIETNGRSEIVQPGTTLSDRLAIVERIERDKIILKSTTKRPKYYVVRMAAAPPTTTQSSPTSGPTSRRRGGMPGSGENDMGGPPM